jgi:hypothetical protein
MFFLFVIFQFAFRSLLPFDKNVGWNLIAWNRQRQMVCLAKGHLNLWYIDVDLVYGQTSFSGEKWNLMEKKMKWAKNSQSWLYLIGWEITKLVMNRDGNSEFRMDLSKSFKISLGFEKRQFWFVNRDLPGCLLPMPNVEPGSSATLCLLTYQAVQPVWS